MNANYYDIESLQNAFTLANYKPSTNEVDLYYLVDEDPAKPGALAGSITLRDDVAQCVYSKNKNFTGKINLYNLDIKDNIRYMAKEFGFFDTKIPNKKSNVTGEMQEYRMVCDTDPEYDPNKHPYLCGYNSYNYDTTILSLFFANTMTISYMNANDQTMYTNSPYKLGDKVVDVTTTTAKAMREHNDKLFSKQFIGNMKGYLAHNPMTNRPDYNDNRWVCRKGMLMTNRHIDVAKLNEKATKIGLKRILGMLGHQILESDKLGPTTSFLSTKEEFYELLAYNVSDVVNLKYVMEHRIYSSNFSLKQGLIDTYPDIIYQELGNTYTPNITPDTVRRDRLTVDSTSAMFASTILSPYGNLKDMEVVDLSYPSENKVKELAEQGIHVKRVNVLEESRKFLHRQFPDDTPQHKKIRDEFEQVYLNYKSIQGKNFNASPMHIDPNDIDAVSNISAIQAKNKANTCMRYYYKNGQASSGYAKFSVGGVHGGEYNLYLYNLDKQEYKRKVEEVQGKLNDLMHLQAAYPDPADIPGKTYIDIPGWTEIKKSVFIKRDKDTKRILYRDPESFTPKTLKPPELFKESKVTPQGKYAGWAINKRYTFTSAEVCHHEDFTSYYPNLLRMMDAFYNEGLGKDRYAEIFQQKEDYGKLMKDKSLSEEERSRYAILREGTKLILNSASGAGDVTYDTPIRMNNTIISMRLIGQLFSWRIGQAQTYEGAKIISTNTDGLYSVMDKEINDMILEQESKDIGVEIEPEQMLLISKDANNRVEFDMTANVLGAGGDIGAYKGPAPTKALAHAAYIDYIMVYYLRYEGMRPQNPLGNPFNLEYALEIIKQSFTEFNKAQLLNMLQTVVSSSIGSKRYIFSSTLDANGEIDGSTAKLLQHYNRVFVMKEGTKDAYNLNQAIVKDAKGNVIVNDPIACNILKDAGIDMMDTEYTNKVSAIQKISGLEPTTPVISGNKDLFYMSEIELNTLLNSIDFSFYLERARQNYEKNWRNQFQIAKNTQSRVVTNEFIRELSGSDIEVPLADMKNGTVHKESFKITNIEQPELVSSTLPPLDECLSNEEPEPETNDGDDDFDFGEEENDEGDFEDFEDFEDDDFDMDEVDDNRTDINQIVSIRKNLHCDDIIRTSRMSKGDMDKTQSDARKLTQMQGNCKVREALGLIIR